MNLPLSIAWRYLRSKKTHNAVNIISIISMCGVVVTTAALICVLSVFNGFQDLIMSRLAKLDPMIEITPSTGKTIAQADAVISSLKALPQVLDAQPVVEDQGLAIFADYQMPVRLRGVPLNYNEMVGIDSVLVDGDFVLRDQVSAFTVMGAGPAIQLKARPGYLRMVSLYAPRRQGRINVSNPVDAFRSDSVFVSGIFQLNQQSYDADMMYIPIDMARDLFDYTHEATHIHVKTVGDVKSAMAAIKGLLPSGKYVVKDRLMQQAEAYRLVNIEKWVTFLLLAFILIIATFNVVSTLSLLIIEKDESIDTLRSLGADDKMITRIFVYEGWLIALIGAVIGVVCGLVLCLAQQQFGLLRLNGDTEMMIVSAYPVKVVWSDVLVVFALVAAVGLITSLVTSLITGHRLRRRT